MLNWSSKGKKKLGKFYSPTGNLQKNNEKKKSLQRQNRVAKVAKILNRFDFTCTFEMNSHFDILKRKKKTKRKEEEEKILVRRYKSRIKE